MLSIPLIPTVQSMEVEKEVKSMIEENIKNFSNKFTYISLLELFIIIYIISAFISILSCYYVILSLLYSTPSQVEKIIIFIMSIFLGLYFPILMFVSTILKIILQPIEVIKTTLTLIKYMILDIIENIKEIIERIKTRIIVIIEIIIEILNYIKNLINPSYQANIT